MNSSLIYLISPYLELSQILLFPFFGSHLILTPNTNMYKRVYIAKDDYKSRYFIGRVEVTDFLFSKMSTVISTLLGCFKDIYFALTY